MYMQINNTEFSPQVIELFRKTYNEKKETIEYKCKFGSPIERAKASLIRDVALIFEQHVFS
jgi:hypothetical protein